MSRNMAMATATPSYARSLASCVKRLKLSPPATTTQARAVQTSRRLSAQPVTTTSSSAAAAAPPSSLESELASLRLPKAVQATYLAPLHHNATHGFPSCDLQLRSYSVRNLEIFVDFALRAAYYLKLPAKGPTFMPRITERWTVPRSNFVHKKSQENFERITMRRGIRILDGHPETVAIWLAYLRKHQYYGVGMKANVYDYSGVNVGQDMDAEGKRIAQFLGEEKMFPAVFRSQHTQVARVAQPGSLLDEAFKGQWGGYAALGGSPSVPSAKFRVPFVQVTTPEHVEEMKAKKRAEREEKKEGK